MWPMQPLRVVSLSKLRDSSDWAQVALSSGPLRGCGGPLRGCGRPLRGRGEPLRGRGGPLRGHGGPLRGLAAMAT